MEKVKVTEQEFYIKLGDLKETAENVEEYLKGCEEMLKNYLIVDDDDNEIEFDIEELKKNYQKKLGKIMEKNIETLVKEEVHATKNVNIEVVGPRNEAKNYGFKSFQEYALTIKGNRYKADKRLEALAIKAPTAYGQESVGADGGFAVPPDFQADIIDMNSESEDLAAQCDIVRTSSDHVQMVVDPTTPWGTSGIQAYWTAEGAQITNTAPVVNPRIIYLQACAALIPATEQLLSDAPRMRDHILVKAREAVRSKVNESIWKGTGTGQPLGVSNSGAFLGVTKESSGNSGNIIAENVAKIFSAMHPDYLDGAFWMVSQSTFTSLLNMKIGETPIFGSASINGAFVGPVAGYLLGKPVVISKYASVLGTAGDINFLNLRKGYQFVVKVGEEQGKIAESMHLYFDYNINTFRLVFRCGGAPLFNASVTLPSTQVVSPYVTVETR